MRIIQLLENLTYGDGMGNHAILTHHLLKQAGYHVETYSGSIHPNVPKGIAKPFWESFSIEPEDILLFQFGNGGRVPEVVEGIPCRKIMMYHNITPPEFLKGYNSHAYQATSEGYRLLKRWIKNQTFDVYLVASSYNANDLIKMGVPAESISRLNGYLMPLMDYQEMPDPDVMEDFDDGITNILFVGRVSPNKKHEDIIRAFAYYQEHIEPLARLIFVGGGEDGGYGRALKEYIEELGVRNVIFSGHISIRQLIAFYQCADVFVCMSEHEGFCIPLIEAMMFDVSIVAYSAAAVPDTLGEAGVLLTEKNPARTAKWIERIVKDDHLRTVILEKQRERLKYFDQKVIGQQLQDFIQQFIDENIKQYQCVDAMGVHEKELGDRIDDTLYRLYSRNLARVGERMPISCEKYMMSIKAYEVRK